MTAISKIITASALALTALSTPALASEEGNHVQVSYADLNLSSKAGQDIFERRIRSAVRSVCGGRAQPNLSFGRPVRKCIKATSVEAMEAYEVAVASYNTQRLAWKERKVRFAIR